jgi:hypothetical protein
MKKILVLLLISMSFAFNISAANEIVGPDVIYKPTDKVLTLSGIKALYSTQEEGDIEVIEDNYTGFGDKPGIYTIVLGVGAFEKEIQVSVRNIGNVVAVTRVVDDYTIHMFKNQSLTVNGIIDVLQNIQLITVTSTTEITILTNTYTDNMDAPGTYVFEFHLANTAGFEQTYEVNIKVSNSEKLLPDIVVNDRSTEFWNNLWLFFQPVAVIGLIGMFLLVILKVKKRVKGRRAII